MWSKTDFTQNRLQLMLRQINLPNYRMIMYIFSFFRGILITHIKVDPFEMINSNQIFFLLNNNNTEKDKYVQNKIGQTNQGITLQQ